MPEKMIAIVGMGMVTAVGLDAKQTAASIRAGIARFEETSICDKRFEPFVMATLPDQVLPPLKSKIAESAGLTAKQTRMLQLATPALMEAVGDRSELKNAPLYLGIPQPLPDRPSPFDHGFLQCVQEQLDIPFNIDESVLVPKGRVAGLFALDYAVNAISSGKHPFAIVGGIDTCIDLYMLGALDLENRILGTHVMNGFIPGEGASFLVLANLEGIRSDNSTPLALIAQVTKDHEPGHLYSEHPYHGKGLATAVQQFIKTSGIHEPILEVFTSMNGENYWAKEWGVAYLRNNSSFDPNHGFHHPADCIGDTGAASGIILINLAAIGIRKKYYRSPSLITCSSDFGERAVTGVFAP